MTITIKSNTATQSAINTNGIDSVLIEPDKIKFNLPIVASDDVPYAKQIDASTTVKGLVELATTAETNSTATNRVVTPAGFKATLAAGTGASLIGWIRNATGAVSRTLASKLGDTVSVKDFGAVGDGVTDDTAAFTAAHSLLSSMGGGTIILPDGKYRLNSTFAVTAGNMSIVGGQGVEIINGVADGPAIKIGNGGSYIYNASVAYLKFSCASGVAATANNRGLLVSKVSQSSFIGVKTSQYPAKLSNGVRFEECSQCFLDGMAVQDTGGVGVDIYRCNDLYGHSMRSDANGIGWRIEDTNGIFFTAASAYGNTIHGWSLQSDGILNNNTNHFYTSCVGDTSGQMNWAINQLKESSFVGSWGSTQINAATNTFSSGFYLDGDHVRNIRFIGAQALFNNQHGFHIEKAAKVALVECSFGSETHGNGRSGYGNGLYFGPNAVGCTVSGGSAEENHDYGISSNPSASSIIITGIKLFANGVGAVLPGTFGGSRIGRDISGFSPLSGVATTPSFPATGTAVTNNTGFDCTVTIFTGTVSAIYVDGSYCFNKTDVTLTVKAGSTITIDYTVQPLWKWLGL